MQTVGPYLQESKDEIVSRFRQSGLSQTRFCKLSDVPISNSTLSEWLRKAGYDKCGNPCEKKQEQDRSMLNIVCYNVGENADHQVKEEYAQQPSLQQMVAFQQEVHDLCIRLYRLGCSKESITLIGRIKGVL
ncbi:MAG: hypothetical protein PHS76_02990 [Sphaerochaeta sp.]|jgi:hypothetical protein|nr:hypothetical protein [Sphaerochaeta sp.]